MADGWGARPQLAQELILRAEPIGQLGGDRLLADAQPALDVSTCWRVMSRLRITLAINTSVMSSAIVCNTARPSGVVGSTLLGLCVLTMSIRVFGRLLGSGTPRIVPMLPSSAVSSTTNMPGSTALAIQ